MRMVIRLSDSTLIPALRSVHTGHAVLLDGGGREKLGKFLLESRDLT